MELANVKWIVDVAKEEGRQEVLDLVKKIYNICKDSDTRKYIREGAGFIEEEE